MKRIALFLVVFLLAVAVPAQAADRGFYVGGGLGKSDLDVADLFPELEIQRGSQSTFGFKVFGGYRILDFLAVEAGYTDVGTEKTWETSSMTVHHEVKVGLNGWNASAVGLVPLGSVDLFAKVGVMSWDAGLDIETVDSDDSEKYSGTDMTFGLGIGFNFKHVFARGELEWFNAEEISNIMMVSISVGYLF